MYEIILAIIQGLTEWLPISSSGHLALAEYFLGMKTDIAYDLALHLGTLLAVLIYFRKELWNMTKVLFTWKTNDEQFQLIGKLALASIITGIFGYLFYDIIATSFYNLTIIGLLFIINGIYLVYTARYQGNKKTTWKHAAIIGTAQLFSLFSSISRSGATIGTALLLGIKKEEAFKFSFLLSIPAILGANIYMLNNETISWNPINILGIIIAAIVGYLALIWCKKWLLNNKFTYFGWYTIILGIAVLAISLL
ncbi:MAG: undecaprenyl-diphosphate phosphatase [Nanoarchaeota archaeon]|nr:undecaprenyl-diphosphate phosphatase [Nanoarchaeota archaeon]